MRDQPERMDNDAPASEAAPARKAARPDPVDEASKESFPASDPPSSGPLHSGPPSDAPDSEEPSRD